MSTVTLDRHGTRVESPTLVSTSAVHSDLKRCTELAHPVVAESSEALNKNRDGDALNRVEVDSGTAGDWIIARFQHDLAGQSADRGRTGSDERASQPWNGRVTREHDNWATTYI
jgi:hypothetical protein